MKEIKIITIGDIFKNLETEEKALKFKDYIKDLQQKVEQLVLENEQLRTELNTKDNIINELENYTSENIEVLENRLNSPFCNFEKATKELLIFQNYLDKLKELKEGINEY